MDTSFLIHWKKILSIIEKNRDHPGITITRSENNSQVSKFNESNLII